MAKTGYIDPKLIETAEKIIDLKEKLKEKDYVIRYAFWLQKKAGVTSFLFMLAYYVIGLWTGYALGKN